MYLHIYKFALNFELKIFVFVCVYVWHALRPIVISRRAVCTAVKSSSNYLQRLSSNLSGKFSVTKKGMDIRSRACIEGNKYLKKIICGNNPNQLVV